MKKILVTGGAGYIGSACVKALIEEGDKVTVFDDFSTGQKDKISADSEVIEGSLCNFSDISEVCRLGEFDAVMHFAAKKAVAESEANPSLYFANNVLGSFNLLRSMEEFKIPQIIFSSTAAVYAPIVESKKITESSLVAPISVYGVTKLMVEDMIKSYFRTGKISQFSILRYFNVAGDSGVNFQENNPQNVFPILANKLKNDETFEIFGDDYETEDGTCIRDYIHLEDLINGHLLALHSADSGIFNLGTGTGYSVMELVDSFSKNSGKKIDVRISPRRAGDSVVVVADAALAKNILGWSPKKNLDDMILDTINVYK